MDIVRKKYNISIEVLFPDTKEVEAMVKEKGLNLFYESVDNRKFFLANNVKLALNLKIDGAYISAYNRDCRFNNYIFHKNFKLIGSVHNLKDLKFKKNQSFLSNPKKVE